MACLILGLASAVSSPVQAEPVPQAGHEAEEGVSAEPGLALKLLDLFVVRPAALAQTVIGGALLVVVVPLSAFSGAREDVLDTALRKPLDYTFRRPLGEL